MTVEEADWIRNHPVIRIAPDPDFPPVEYFDEKGTYRGISADFMKIIQDRTGLTFDVVHCHNWVEVLDRIKKGQIDLLTAAGRTPDREVYLNFTDPHIVLPGVIVCQKKVKGPLTLDDLRGKKVCVVKSYVWEEYLKQDHPEINLKLVEDVSDGLKFVSFGFDDAFIGTLPVILYYIEKNGISNLKIVGESGYYTHLSLAVRKDCPELYSIMSKAVASLTPQEKKAIITRYISAMERELTFSPRFWWTLAMIILAAGVVFTWILTWNRVLVRKVERRTRELKEELKQRKFVEESLRQSQNLLTDVFESIQDGLWVLNLDLTIRFSNSVMRRNYGYQSDLDQQKKCHQVLMKRDEPCDDCPVLRCLDSGETELKLLPVPGKKTQRWMEIFAYPMRNRTTGEVTGIIEFLRDVTSRKHTEEVREIMYRISEAVEKTRNIMDLCVKVKEALARVMDTRNFIVGLYDSRKDVVRVKYVADEEDQIDLISLRNTISGKVIRENKPCLLREKDIELLEKKGEVKLVGMKPKSWLGVPLRLEDQVVGLIVIQSYDPDVIYDEEHLHLLEFLSTQIASAIDRVQTRESIRKLFTAVEQSPVLVVITDKNGNIEYINPRVTAVTGYSYDEVIGQNPRIFQSGLTPKTVYREMWETILQGRSWKGEWQNKKKDGSLYWESVHISPIRDENGDITHFIGIKEDITQRKRMREELQQARKMESIGTLSGGIAHDFNNLLTPILGYTEMIIENRAPEDPIVQDLKEVKIAAEKARNLVWKLLAFSRKQTLTMGKVDVNRIVREFVKIFKRTFREDIDVKLDLQPEIPPILADSTQIEQVLVNLVTNAQDAMPEGGVLTIRTYSQTIGSSDTHFRRTLQPGEYIVLEVTDTGIGMEKNVMQHIFEPFFTTKDVGKGTGMGLATVYGIVKQHGGDIVVSSKPGVGTTFKVYFPVFKKEIESDRSTPTSVDTSKVKGKETIVVVEDNPAVRNLLVRVLKKYGFHVIPASDPNDCFRKIDDLDTKVDLLITDIIMPGMNGRELYQKLEKRIPGLKVIYMSGYSQEIIGHHGVLDEDIEFIQKPVSIHALVAKIKEVLER